MYGQPDNTNTMACPYGVRSNRVPLDSCVTCKPGGSQVYKGW